MSWPGIALGTGILVGLLGCSAEQAPKSPEPEGGSSASGNAVAVTPQTVARQTVTAQTVTPHSVAVADGSLHYLEAGTADGLDVMLLHGARFRASTWQECGTFAVLAGAGFHVVALDLPGFGDSAALPWVRGSRRVVIPGAGHPCYLDQPDVFHDALLEFLRSL